MIKRFLFLLAMIFFLPGVCIMAENPDMGKHNDPEVLYLVPFDQLSTGVLKKIGEALKEQLHLEYHIMPSEKIPGSSFNPQRRQYHSPDFLTVLAEKYAAPGRRVLGIVDKDLYVPELNFVFGQADMRDKAAVISLARLRQGFYSLPEDQELFERRSLTEAVHELGHTYRLPHCKSPHCVMFFSNSLRDTDRKGYRFCAGCLKRME